MRLKYTTTRWDGEKGESDYWISLETTLQPFGGRRWWLICPRTGRRVAKLYLPSGAFTFASRQAYRLAYACQREPGHERALRRAFKLVASSGRKVESENTWQNPSGCAGGLMTELSREWTRRKRPWSPHRLSARSAETDGARYLKVVENSGRPTPLENFQ